MHNTQSTPITSPTGTATGTTLGRWIYAAAVIGISGMAAALVGCNTVEGVGEDVEAAGEAIDDEAEEANF